jgi:predicted metal-dependent HD superfamily phosphohydrolase
MNSSRQASLLEASWARCWGGLGAMGDGRALMRRVLDAYGEPQRRYHTARHLSECVKLLAQSLDLAAAPAEVEMAVWFHDAVYDPRAEDNEERSANWARGELCAAGIGPGRAARVAGLVLATRHSAPPVGQDQRLLVDVDLAILGAARARFEEYESQIRAEYGWVAEDLYRRKRREILEGFLARTPLYITPCIRDAFEARARANLIRSIQRLSV